MTDWLKSIRMSAGEVLATGKSGGRSIAMDRTDGAARLAVDAGDFGGPAFFADPYATYARLRGHGSPVWEPKSGAWLISRYGDVEAMLRDSRLSKNSRRETPTPFETAVLFQDPPDHTRARGVLNRAMSGEAMQGIEDRIRQIADSLIERMQQRGMADFISAFAAPLPLAVMSGLLGINPEAADRLHDLSGAFIVEDSATPEESQRRQYASICGMTKYFQELISSRDAQGPLDLLGAIIQADGQADGLTHQEALGNCILLMIAGHETTVNLLGNGLYLLLRHREQLERLKRQPELWPSAIEEMLRFESPVQLGTFRLATEPIQIAGCTVDAGSAITAVIGSANRDPEQFPEPDRFDITRAPNRHLAFGMGPHRCMGAALVHMEARIGFTRLFERLPNLHQASEQAKGWFSSFSLLKGGFRRSRPAPGPKWRRNAITRGLTELMVTW